MIFDDLVRIDDVAAGSSVAVAGADDEAVLGAFKAGVKAGIRFHLVGDVRRIRKTAESADLSLDLDQAVLVDTRDADEAEVCRIAVGLCVRGAAGVLMKGLVGTAAFTKAILDKSGGLTRPGSLLSHTGLFEDPRNGGVFLLTDAAINVSPDVEAKKKILANAVSVARALGIRCPAIALLAPVEKVSPRIQSTLDARDLRDWVSSGGLGAAVADGPFALDVAASSEAAAVKGLVSEVAGRADIYLAPGLDAGNVLYKALTVFAGARAAGILAGAMVPVVLTSRADPETVKIASLGLALRVAAAAG